MGFPCPNFPTFQSHDRRPFLGGGAATWWVGLILGIPIAFVSTSGTSGWWMWRRLLKPMSLLVLLLWLSATLGYLVSSQLSFRANTYALGFSPKSDDDLLRFSSVLVTHNVSYIAGAVGGLFLARYINRKRANRRFSIHRSSDHLT